MIVASDVTLDNSRYQGTKRNNDLFWDKRSVITYADKVVYVIIHTYIHTYIRVLHIYAIYRSTYRIGKRAPI